MRTKHNLIKRRLKQIGLVIVLITCGLLISCDLTEQRYYERIKGKGAEEQSDKVVIYDYKDNSIARKMVATKVERYYDKGQLEAFDVTIIDYNEAGDESMHLTAKRLIIDEQKNTYRAEGNVVVNRNGNYLYTEILVWDQIYDTIYTPDEVTLVRGGNTLKGYELRTDTEFRNISLNKVRAEGAIDEKNIGF